jgi:ABC-type antimicrobial peptide transport system permease subunit
MVLFFGLIHGLGFSNYLGMLLGRNEGIFIPLLGFNVGVELGQICIIAIFMLVSFICLDILKIKQKYWIGMISILAIVVSLKLMIGN